MKYLLYYLQRLVSNIKHDANLLFICYHIRMKDDSNSLMGFLTQLPFDYKSLNYYFIFSYLNYLQQNYEIYFKIIYSFLIKNLSRIYIKYYPYPYNRIAFNLLGFSLGFCDFSIKKAKVSKELNPYNRISLIYQELDLVFVILA